MLGTFGHWAVRGFSGPRTPTLTRDIRLHMFNGHLRGPVTLTLYAERLAV